MDGEQAYDSISMHYDLMMQDRSSFISYYTSLLESSDSSILDIACGTGAITIELARRLRRFGRSQKPRVIGLDISEGMLEIARQHDADILWLQGDMRRVPDECGPVSLVTCCYNSLQHLDAVGLSQALRSIRSILELKGRFAFDIYRPNLPYLRVTRTDTLARELKGSDGRRLEIREDAVFDESTGLLTLTWRLVHAGATGEPPLAQTSYEMWQHSPESVEAALAAAGFEITQRYGDLDRSPWHSQAKKQVVVCRVS
jgi:SAM-dependent methyltransferase